MMGRTVVLICGKRKRTYPLAPDVPLKDEYWIGGECWTVVAVLTSQDVPVNTETLATP